MPCIVNKFNEYFSNIGPNSAKLIDPCDGSFTDTISQHYSINQGMFVSPTDESEITNIVHGFKAHKSAGYDSFSPTVIKSVIKGIAQPLTSICNLSIQVGSFPDKMKIAKVCPIFKSDDKYEISNYRPISILPMFSKILEKLLFNRLLSFLNMHNILTPNQFGFREKYSTFMALLNLVDRISDKIDNKEYSIGIFMDLSKAFDTVDHDILLSKLELYGIRGVALKWFKSYLEHRTQFVQIKNTRSSMLPVICGVPQGSILGPLLFIVYINDIIHVSEIADIILYADDTNIFFSHSSLDTLLMLVNNELLKISKWFKLNKLSLNIKKTNYIRFRSKRKTLTDRIINIAIDGINILEVQKLNFLAL